MRSKGFERDETTKTLAEKIEAMRERMQRGEVSFVEAPPTPLEECPNCGDMGIVYKDVPVGHPDFGKAFTCPLRSCRVGNERRQLVADRITKQAVIPEQYQKHKLEDFLTLPSEYKKGKWAGYGAALMLTRQAPFTMQQAYEAAGFKAAGEGSYESNWVVLTGDYGVGKTTLAGGLANWCAHNGVSVLFIRVGSFLQAIRDSYKDDAEIQTGQILQTAQTVNVLIADEWKEGPHSNHSLDKMEEVIRYRYNHRLPTLFTTNLNVKEFKAAWGERTGSVVAEAHWIEMWGLSLRNETAKAVRSEF